MAMTTETRRHEAETSAPPCKDAMVICPPSVCKVEDTQRDMLEAIHAHALSLNNLVSSSIFCSFEEETTVFEFSDSSSTSSFMDSIRAPLSSQLNKLTSRTQTSDEEAVIQSTNGKHQSTLAKSDDLIENSAVSPRKPAETASRTLERTNPSLRMLTEITEPEKPSLVRRSYQSASSPILRTGSMQAHAFLSAARHTASATMEHIRHPSASFQRMRSSPTPLSANISPRIHTLHDKSRSIASFSAEPETSKQNEPYNNVHTFNHKKESSAGSSSSSPPAGSFERNATMEANFVGTTTTVIEKPSRTRSYMYRTVRRLAGRESHSQTYTLRSEASTRIRPSTPTNTEDKAKGNSPSSRTSRREARAAVNAVRAEKPSRSSAVQETGTNLALSASSPIPQNKPGSPLTLQQNEMSTSSHKYHLRTSRTGSPSDLSSSNHKKYTRRPSQPENEADASSSSQQSELSTSNHRTYNRRPSQPQKHTETSSLSQQCELSTSNHRVYNRRPSQPQNNAEPSFLSQQNELSSSNHRRYNRRPSHSTNNTGSPSDLSASNHKTYSRRPSVQTSLTPKIQPLPSGAMVEATMAPTIIRPEKTKRRSLNRLSTGTDPAQSNSGTRPRPVTPPSATQLTQRNRVPSPTNASHASEQLQIEIAPGVKSRLRGAKETMDCVERDFYVPTSCTCCSLELCCIMDADYVLCPLCKVVSPLAGADSAGRNGGVGLGFTLDDLRKWQSEIVHKRQRRFS